MRPGPPCRSEGGRGTGKTRRSLRKRQTVFLVSSDQHNRSRTELDGAEWKRVGIFRFGPGYIELVSEFVKG